ncbi:HAMP domain-containing protein [Eubacteriales bacterium OttesenSCG-928-A19]|nr:HAMP domain-containing protein [Eubacteriales bacterium OttesenSCG-928-A19]
MWNRLSLRLRIVLLCATCLLLICAALTAFLVTNAGQSFAVPFDDLAMTVPTIVARTQAVRAMPAVPAARLTIDDPVLSIELDPAVFYTEAISAYQATQATYTYQSYLFMGLILLVGIALIWFITGKALRPVTQLSRKLETIDAQNLSQPLEMPRTQDEVSRLTVSFNHMLRKISTAYDAQRRFAQNAAHELKTPVAAILTSVEVTELTEDTSPQELREALDAVKENARRMACLIEEMLTLNAQTTVNSHETVDFAEMLENILPAMQEEIEQRGITLKVSGDTVLHGDRALLTRVFDNLIRNAVRYNVSGGHIDIDAAPGRITIADTGIGIGPEVLEKVFEPFFCEDMSRSRALGGNGLGLSIVKQILDMHGMGIEIFSETGTTVTVFTNPSLES